MYLSRAVWGARDTEMNSIQSCPQRVYSDLSAFVINFYQNATLKEFITVVLFVPYITTAKTFWIDCFE